MSLKDDAATVLKSPSFWGAVCLAVSQLLIAAGGGHLDLPTVLTAIGIVGAQVTGHADGGR